MFLTVPLQLEGGLSMGPPESLLPHDGAAEALSVVQALESCIDETGVADVWQPGRKTTFSISTSFAISCEKLKYDIQFC